ncbi:unnamed protein product [Meganyctiphanes norvegica]|uniref:Uncharacterized protein n=1 Tax=Meganyctiphanes norvegica TaxID=48144 RepID=A0AAV2Q337_MEGNR
MRYLLLFLVICAVLPWYITGHRFPNSFPSSCRYVSPHSGRPERGECGPYGMAAMHRGGMLPEPRDVLQSLVDIFCEIKDSIPCASVLDVIQGLFQFPSSLTETISLFCPIKDSISCQDVMALLRHLTNNIFG